MRQGPTDQQTGACALRGLKRSCVSAQSVLLLVFASLNDRLTQSNWPLILRTACFVLCAVGAGAGAGGTAAIATCYLLLLLRATCYVCYRAAGASRVGQGDVRRSPVPRGASSLPGSSPAPHHSPLSTKCQMFLYLIHWTKSRPGPPPTNPDSPPPINRTLIEYNGVAKSKG
jgi:hypothetical protein